MKHLILALSFISIFSNIWSQDTKYTNYFNAPEPTETEYFKVTFKNPVSKFNYCKVGLQIDNLSRSFLLIKKSESKFILSFGEFSPLKKSIIIRPNSKKTPTFKVEGSTQFLVDNFTLNLNGVYQIAIDGDVIEMDNFNLPANKNHIKSDQLEVKLLKLKKKTQETSATFEVSYYGDKIAIINESNLVVKIEDGQEFINENTKAKAKLLEKGKTIKIKVLFYIPAKTADMQFENMEIVWKNAFVESEAVLLPVNEFEFIINKGMTEGKN